MQEDFLHYIWKFKKFNFGNAKTVDGTPIVISNSGMHNTNSGPDFFNARIKIGEQSWAGNVEIHLRSSDWYAHRHEEDPNYDNVILHVVWDDDIEIFRKDNSVIPTLELKNLVSNDTLQNYRNLLLAPNAKWINCENEFPNFREFELNNWLERLYLEKLQKKSETIKELHKVTGNNWEAVLFQLLARSFGSKVNAGPFLSLAQSLDFKIIQKCSNSQFKLEALFFGQSGLLDSKAEDGYFSILKEEYNFLKRKFRLENGVVQRPGFFRLRPDNFPSIRLSQFSNLYASQPHLFASVIKTNTRQGLQEIFKAETSNFWKTHYNFGKPHTHRNKKLSDDFIDLIIINTVVPIKFSWLEVTGRGESSDLLQLINEIKTEKNSIIDKFNLLRPGTCITALQSQALLHLKNEYCDKNYCMRCQLGAGLLKGNT